MNCIETIGDNIALNCNNPLAKGYTGRAILIPAEQVDVLGGWTFSRLANNQRVVDDIQDGQSSTMFVIDDIAPTPFSGSGTTGSDEDGFRKFVKTLTIRVPMRGAFAAKSVIEPLARSQRGFLIIAEKVDKVGDGSFEIIGLENPMKVVDPSTIQRSESENGGAWTMTLQTSEFYAEYVLLINGSYDETFTYFNATYNAAI